jgi:hypothetical protein
LADNLRDRIAAVLKAANDRVAGFIGYDEMADAVIEALKLKREETLFSLLPDYERNVVRTNVWATRYVTEWSNDVTHR